MNAYIQMKTDELIKRYVRNGINDDDRLIAKVRDEIYEIKSEKDKLVLLTGILEANELVYQKHMKECPNKENCQTDKKHLKVNYFLQQELEDLGVLSTDNFTWEEKSNCNDKLDEILQTIINSGEILDEKIDVLREEIEELKSLYILGKKNWKQQFAGKMTDMVGSGVLSELTAKPIIDKLLKPGAEFLTGQLLI
jgi:hypothetical protein